MSDEKPPPVEPPSADPPRPLPERYAIPLELIEKWTKIQPGEVVQVSLSRADLDQLFFGLTNTIGAQQALQDALVKWSNGDVQDANKSLDQSRRGNIIADNHVRRFFAAVMAGAKPQ
ncbi:MAG: hypothetical protein U1E60_27260 [Reyranellaceae bacterium]